MNIHSRTIYFNVLSFNVRDIINNLISGVISRWGSGKESACQCRRHRRCSFNPWVGKISWRRKLQQLTPAFLPGGSHGQGAWKATVHRVAKTQTEPRDWAQTSAHTQNIPMTPLQIPRYQRRPTLAAEFCPPKICRLTTQSISESAMFRDMNSKEVIMSP